MWTRNINLTEIVTLQILNKNSNSGQSDTAPSILGSMSTWLSRSETPVSKPSLPASQKVNLTMNVSTYVRRIWTATRVSNFDRRKSPTPGKPRPLLEPWDVVGDKVDSEEIRRQRFVGHGWSIHKWLSIGENDGVAIPMLLATLAQWDLTPQFNTLLSGWASHDQAAQATQLLSPGTEDRHA